METKDNQNNKNGKNILLTAIASLVFIPIIEKILTPAYNYTISYLFSTGNRGIQFISSFFYSRISEGVYINISFYIFIVLISLILIKIVQPCVPNGFPCGIEQIEACGKNSSCGILPRVRCILFCLIKQRQVKKILFVAIYIVFVFLLLTTNFINKTITRTTNNIEIVSPYITDNEYKMLKSSFHSMKCRNDYEELINSLDNISEKYDIELK